MQEILKNSSVKTKIFNKIEEVKERNGNIVFLPYIPEEYPGKKFTIFNEQKIPIDLTEIELSDKDFFMNGEEALSALQTLPTSGFVLYFGTDGFLCIKIKNKKGEIKKYILHKTKGDYLEKKRKKEEEINTFLKKKKKTQSKAIKELEILKDALSDLIILAKNEVKEKLELSSSEYNRITKESISKILENTILENTIQNGTILVFKKPTNDEEVYG